MRTNFSPWKKMFTVVSDERVLQIKLFGRRSLAQGKRQRLIELEELPPPVIRPFADLLTTTHVICFGAQKIFGVDSGSHNVEARAFVSYVQPEKERRHQLTQTIRNSGMLAQRADERVAVVDETRFIIF